ncbi:hypothetical protein FDP25_08740 [Roseovarius sp. A21]|uniref:Sulfotransferase domain-containing protein n=1 Tax=Roseovarius bejariae TaxID=2576383 RepID=A0A844D0W9_9RHOB|nr:hypothetical protein [Roseovarius bejariae]MRU15513.1 hypothetical protein [Roseovarius bejariae]
MTRQILLHIGSPKCGSTYLQRVMLNNRDKLRVQGIEYPHNEGGHPGNAAEIAKLNEAGLNAMFANDAYTVVLSHEDLFSQPPRGKSLAQLSRSQGIKLKAVVFLRPFSQFIYGDYSQFMKQRFHQFSAARRAYDGRNFEEFAVKRSQDMPVAGWLKAWSDLTENSLVLASHRDIRPVIESQLDLPSDMNWTVPATQTNRSLRVSDCEALAAALANHEIPAPELKEMFRSAFHKVDEPDAGRTQERDRWIEALFLDRNKKLHELFGFDNRLDVSRPL